MSDVVVGVGASHSTLMNTHWEEVSGLDRAETFRRALGEARDVVASARPDAVIVVGSNHFRGLWLDLMPAFTIGVGECVMSGESGTPEGRLAVDVELARHLCGSLIAAEFDVAFSTHLQVDHGVSHAVQYVLDGVDAPVVPIVVNVFAPPLPTLARCEAFGRCIGTAIAGDGTTKRVAVIGSGGLSHLLPFPAWDAPVTDDDRFMVEVFTNGRNRWRELDQRRREIIRAAAPRVATGFDEQLLDLVAAGRLDELTGWSQERLVGEGGNGANEVRTWLVMAGACGHQRARVLAYSPMPEWLTGMAVAVIEPETKRVTAIGATG